MTSPERQYQLITESATTRGVDNLSRPEIARILGFVKGRYDYQRFLPPDVDERLSLSTALAAMHAIDAKGQQEGWDDTDLLAALSVTRVALTTAGFPNAKAGLQALLNGTAGGLSEIMENILPQDAPRGVKGIAGTIVMVNSIDNMRVVAGLLIDEKQLERRLLKLTQIQQDLVMSPGRTRALLAVLNGEFLRSCSLDGSGLPQEARAYLERISPFSLEDMNNVNGLFHAIEAKRNSAIQIETHRLQVETELKRLDAAGSNIAKITTEGTESIVKNTLLVVGGTVGGAAGGVILAGDEMVYQIKEAIGSVKRKNAERKASNPQ